MDIQKSIKSWSEDDRPREKMIRKGAAALTDAELLAILIASGTRERSAVDLARDILALANRDLGDLGRLGFQELLKVKGIGQARAITICAALELGRRRQIMEIPEKLTINNSAKAALYIIPRLRDLNHEVFYVLYLNSMSRLLREEVISSGGFTATVADVRMILKNCLLYNATHLIVAHNHPSGSKFPSEPDKILTARIHEAAKLMEIKFIDHLIIAGNEYFSMADEGLF